MKAILTRIIAVLFIALGGSAAFAQYPAHAIKVIVPIPAGGAPDITARVVGQKLSELLGTPVVVENHAGSNGNIAGDWSPSRHRMATRCCWGRTASSPSIRIFTRRCRSIP